MDSYIGLKNDNLCNDTMEDYNDLIRLNEMINLITQTKSKNDKKAIISEFRGNILFKKVIDFVFNPFILTGISSKKINKKIKNADNIDYTHINNINLMIDYLKDNNTGKDKDILTVQNYIESFEDDEIKDMLKDIFTKSLKLGASASTFNKLYDDLNIPEFDIMLAEKYSDYKGKLKNKKFILTIKIDGNRMLLIKDKKGEMTCFSRQGKPLDGLDDILKEANDLPNGFCFDGELVAITDDNATSDDVYKETSKKTRKKGKKEELKFIMFDMLPIDDFKKGICEKPCIERKSALEMCLTKHNKKYKYLEIAPILYVGTDESKIDAFLDTAIENNEEGLMLNLADAPYTCKRTKDILKIKVFREADLRITNIIEGTGTMEGMLGAITVRFMHENEFYECNCGSGFSQEERIEYWNNPKLILDKIATIRFFKITKNDSGTYGLRFPTWINKLRPDKEEISMY